MEQRVSFLYNNTPIWSLDENTKFHVILENLFFFQEIEKNDLSLSKVYK